MSQSTHEVVIVGGGTAGISVAARLLKADPAPRVTIIDPAKKHYYQPIWTLVGGGVVDKSVSERDEAEVIPDGATFINESVDRFDPEHDTLTTASGATIHYDQLVVAPGIQLDWDAVDGLREALGHGGVTSNYAYETVDYTWDLIRNFRGGNAVFTFPATPIKCAGAPQKIMYLAEESFRRQGVRKQSKITYASATPGIFGIPRYKAVLDEIVEARGIETAFRHSLVSIRSKSREAVFRHLDEDREVVLPYDMIHVTPPQSAPDFVKRSALANETGWVDVDKHTTQHVRFPNVFSLGDASSLPCSKTGAAIRKQAPVTARNVLDLRAGRELSGRYDGYASCPLVTGYGRVVLAEFGYDGKIMETFGVNQAKERFSMYALKAHALPSMYWHGMLQGRM